MAKKLEYSERFLEEFPIRLDLALKYREVLGKDLARWLGGMAPGTISAWRTGRAKPPHPDRCRRIEELLLLPEHWLDGLGDREDVRRIPLKELKKVPGGKIILKPGSLPVTVSRHGKTEGRTIFYEPDMEDNQLDTVQHVPDVVKDAADNPRKVTERIDGQIAAGSRESEVLAWLDGVIKMAEQYGYGAFKPFLETQKKYTRQKFKARLEDAAELAKLGDEGRRRMKKAKKKG